MPVTVIVCPGVNGGYDCASNVNVATDPVPVAAVVRTLTLVFSTFTPVICAPLPLNKVAVNVPPDKLPTLALPVTVNEPEVVMFPALALPETTNDPEVPIFPTLALPTTLREPLVAISPPPIILALVTTPVPVALLFNTA
jgi:hypothetical protein